MTKEEYHSKNQESQGRNSRESGYWTTPQHVQTLVLKQKEKSIE